MVWGQEREGQHEIARFEVAGGARDMEGQRDIVGLLGDQGGVERGYAVGVWAVAGYC